jgi:hypothetical protein
MYSSVKQEKTWSHQEIISDVDCYWYRKNLENVNTINCLRKEITDLRTKLIAAENHLGMQERILEINADYKIFVSQLLQAIWELIIL